MCSIQSDTGHVSPYKSRTALLTLLLIAQGSPVAQLPAEQFYANDRGEYGWTESTKGNLRSTTWFAKNPAGNPSYQQLTAVIYDNKPIEVYYLDKATKRVVGRLDMETLQFSLLPPETQKVRQAIESFKFPPGGDLPRVEQMFESLSADKPGNRQKLELPPPTLQFPRLEHSTWETTYLSADKFLIRSIIELNGNRGTYRLTQKPGTGKLSDIIFEREGDEHVIRGNWSLGQSRGHFKFNLPAENLNVFWGEFGFQEGRTVGAWSGVRKIGYGSKERKKSVR